MKRFLLFAAIFLCPVLCWGQQTTIVATVTDPSGRPYTFLTGNASIQCPGNQQPTFNGSPLQRTISITGGDGNGHFTQVLWDVNSIVPTGCSWRWAITWSDGVTTFITGNINGVTGSGPVDLSAAISAFAVPLPASAGAVGSVSATAPIVATPSPIISIGTISCPTCTTGSGASPQVGFWTAPKILSGSPQFTWADGINSTGLFTGPATSTLSTNLQIYFFGEVTGNQNNKHVGSGGAASVGNANLFQIDSNAGGWGTYTASDFTNCPTCVAVGSQSDLYYNVPMGMSNPNEQVAIEDGITVYGAGTSIAGDFSGNVTNSGTGTVSQASSFDATGHSNIGGGSITNAYGFLGRDQANLGTAQTAAFIALAQTTGTNAWGFFSDSTNKDHFGPLFSGTDNSIAGSLTVANNAANAHTTWASAATASNTIKGFATAPTTGHLVTCTTVGVICTLTDGGSNPIGTSVLKKGTNAGNYQSATGSFAAVDGTNLAFTTNIPVGTNLIVHANGNMSPTGGTSTWYVALFDGASKLDEQTLTWTAAGASGGCPGSQNCGTEAFSLQYLIVGDGASHTIQLEYATEGASNDTSGRILNSAGMFPTMIFTFQ